MDDSRKDKSRREILNHLNDRAWIKNFLEKHIWFEHQTAYPSLVGSVLGEMIGRKEINRREEGDKQAYVFINEENVTEEFLKRYRRINEHIRSEKHFRVLELLFGLALIIIQKELESFQEFNIFIQKPIHGGRPDFTIEIPWKIKIHIDLKNRFSNFSDSNAREIINKYSEANATQMVIHPFLSAEAQKVLTNNDGFFCNIGRIYTGYYDGIIDDFSKEGLQRGTIVIKGDIVKIYSELKEDIERKNFRFYERAKEIFKNEPLNFFLRKIRGITNFAILKYYFKSLEKFHMEAFELGLTSINISKRDLELLRAVPLAYFVFLFQPTKRITVSMLAKSLTRYPELKYFKKLDSDRKRDLARDAAKFLQKKGFIKIESKNKWYADDVESPYPSKRDILNEMEMIEI
ncbi:hypothetical protein DRP05_04945 [Archaeoglobales archaeon]|nr:MAG: hypothetical protein DRP05_04945 [Archaeoglobales archaeon]